jgi:hypothetical protein
MKNMKQLLLLSLVLLLEINLFAQNGSTITISGQVTDFEGNPIDSCMVQLMHKDFSTAYYTYSDKAGHYTLKDVEKGKYMAMYALCPKEYPRENAVPEEDMRLEFWAWNVIADKNLTINPRYHRLELYGFQVFEVMGSGPYLMAYVRPMSLGKYISYSKDVYLDKSEAEKVANISVQTNDIEFKLYADNEPLTIHSVQSVEEYGGENNQSITGFFLQFDRPKKIPDSYCIFRIEATHKLFGGEKGENLYFYELKDYK